METIEEFETFVRDRVVALHMGLPQKISARKLSYAIGQSAGCFFPCQGFFSSLANKVTLNLC